MAGGKRHFKELEKRLKALGYRFDHAGGKASSMWVYSHDAAPDLSVNPGLSETAARAMIRDLEKLHGCRENGPKRQAARVKERQAASREHQREALARLEAERAEILRRKERSFDGVGLTREERLAVERRVEEIDRERRALEAQMTAVPTTATHRGRTAVSHQSGAR